MRESQNLAEWLRLEGAFGGPCRGRETEMRAEQASTTQTDLEILEKEYFIE